MSFDQSGGSQNISGIPSRSASQISRKSVPTIPENAGESSQPEKRSKPSGIPSAFTFSSFGGPGDWEHYGEGPDEIDDTAMYGVKQDDEVNQPPPMGVELPAAPVEEIKSIQQPATSAQAVQSQVPPPPSDVHEMEHTPPALQPTPPLQSGPSEPPRTNFVMGDDGWSSAQSTGAPIPPPKQPSKEVPPTATSFVMGDDSYAPAQSTKAPTVPPQRPPTAPPPTSTSFVMNDDGGLAPPAQAVPGAGQSQGQASVSRFEQDAAASKLQAEIEQHRSAIFQMESTLSEINKQAEQQRQLLENESQKAQTARDEAAAIRAQFEQANASLEAQTQELQSVQSRAAELEQKLAQADNALKLVREQFDAERATLQKSISDSQVALADAHKMNDSEKQHLEAKVTELEASMAASTAAAATEHDKLQKQAEEHLQEIESLKTQLKEHSQELDDTKKQLEEEKNKPVDLLPGLNDWFKGSFERFKATLEIEASAPTTQEKLQAFVEFVNNESRLRGVNMPFTPAGKPIGFQPLPSPPTQAQVSRGPDEKPQRPSISTPADSFTMVEQDGEYSPGGRPILRPALLQTERARSESPAKKRATVDSTAGVIAGGAPPVPAKEQYQPYRRGSLPSAIDHAVPRTPLKVDTSQKQPAYQPFVYRPGGSSGAIQTATADRVQSPDLERHSVSAPTVPTLSNVTKPENEIFIDELVEGPTTAKKAHPPVIINEAMVPPPLKPKTPAPHKLEAPPPAQNISPLEHLAELVPPLKIHVPTVPARIAALQKGLASYPSDYAFITTLTKTWEQKAGAVRRRLDEERHARQEANEARTNELFESDEIGYGDIAELEDQQKDEELERQTAEERDELANYSKEVFDSVFRTLQEQIAGLMDLYADAEDAMKSGLAGVRALDIREGDPEVEVSEAMGMLLRIHAAVEERHREVIKAVAERDKRFKRTQTNPLYRRSQFEEMKRLEKGFEANDRRADVRAAVERVERCKRLWKVMDDHCLRGVSENQNATEKILKAVEAVTEDASISQDADKSKEKHSLLQQARAAIADLAANSKRLMQHFEVAEMDLNECEYDVSVSSARLDGQKPEFFNKLQGEKTSEDKRLKEESAKRMSAIDEDLRAVTEVVDEALGSGGGLGVGQGDDAVAGLEDDEQKRRLKAALEEAKRRNGETT
jgi:hypothetical protein